MLVDPLSVITILTENGEIQFLHPRQTGLEGLLKQELQGGIWPMPSLPQDYRFGTVVVIGAGLGAEALHLMHLHRPRRMICFEPDGGCFGLLCRNLEKMPRAECLPWGLLDRDGLADLYPGMADCQGSSLAPGPATTGQPITVEVRRASSELARLRVSGASLLTIDTAGGEALILRDLEGLLDRIDILRVTYHSDGERRVIDRLTDGKLLLAWSKAETPHNGIAVYLHRRLTAPLPVRPPVSAEALAATGWRSLGGGDKAKAEETFRAALAVNDANGPAQHGLGLLALEAGDMVTACRLLRGAMAVSAERAPFRTPLSQVIEALAAKGRREDGALLMETAVLLAGMGEVDIADRALAAVAELDPADPNPFWMRNRLAPRAYRNDGEMAEWHGRMTKAILRLESETPQPATPSDADALVRGLLTLTNFPLAYFGEDERSTQESFGRLTCRLMAARFPKYRERPLQPGRSGDQRLRVGYVSANFSAHTISLLFNGWIRLADRNRFKLHIYVSGGRSDRVTATFSRQAERFADLRSASVEAMVETIAADELDVLVYPDLGMDTRSFCLAGLRLAPVQCVSWGHPITTGLPTMDYFLTSDLMEPKGGEAHYSETLVRLPRLSIAYIDPVPRKSSVTREKLGLPEGLLYLCSQAQQKYLPAHDWLFPAIAQKVPQAKFVFVLHNRDFLANEIFRERLEKAFLAQGLEPSRHLIFLPWLAWEDFLSLNEVCDIFLDSIGWSGGNTALEALSHGLPIVTLPGPLMRGRHSYAFLRLLEAEEGIAGDLDDYVNRAARLGADPALRRKMVSTITANRQRLFDDADAVRQLEAFYLRATR